MNAEVEKIQASELAKKLDYYLYILSNTQKYAASYVSAKIKSSSLLCGREGWGGRHQYKYRNILIGLGKNRIFSFQLL